MGQGQDGMGALGGASDSAQSNTSGGANPSAAPGMTQSLKSSSSKDKKTQQQKDREKNIKEIKMYYWTKVDQGDRTEVVKILTFAK